MKSHPTAFVSDSNLKRAEALQERNKIQMRRVENESIEMKNKKRFESEKMLQLQQMQLNKKEWNYKDKELNLKERELAVKVDLW